MSGPEGWRRIGPHPDIARWAEAARLPAEAALAADGAARRCGGTWQVGLDLLPNGPDGAIGGTAFPWRALGLRPEALHAGQISTVYPGYPQPSEGESAAAFRFRQRRDAAHLDGLSAEGPMKRRFIREPHGFILGLALGDVTASPLVVWEGSQRILQPALAAALRPFATEDWGGVDVTEAYQAARAEVFDRCARREVVLRRGEAVVLHRMLVHGVAPWTGLEQAPRAIVYFRPLMPGVADWITTP